MKTRLTWFATAFVLVCLPAQAAPKARVVVLGFNGSTEQLKRVGDTVAEQILTELGKSGRADAISPTEVQAVLGVERQRHLLNCNDDASSCLAEMTAALGAPWLITGNLGQFGKVSRLDIKLIDATTGKAAWRDGASIGDDTDLFALVATMVKNLLPVLDPKGATSATAAPAATVGAAQVTAAASPPAQSGSVAPWVVAGAGAAALVGGGVMFLMAQGDAADLTTKLASSSPPGFTEAKARLSGDRSNEAVGGILAGVGVAALAGGLAWHFLGGAQASAPAVTASVVPGGFVVSGRF